MPKLWNQTIDAHKRNVRDSTLDAAAALVMRKGIASVTMSEIAQETGIGRATLYKYFPDVEAVLHAWHERQIGRHLEVFIAIAKEGGSPLARLQKLLETFARIAHEHHDNELSAMLHRGRHVGPARRHLANFIASIIAEGVAAGEVRADIAPGELAPYCLSAVAGAADMPSKAAVGRLVSVTLSALRPPV
jgi:AcrR family transcriptional regulator